MHRKKVIVILLAALMLFLSLRYNLPAVLTTWLEYIQSLGTAGIIAFILLYILATVAFLPGSILTLGAGFVFGFLQAVVYVSIASTLGATAAFLLGRGLFRREISLRTGENPKFKAIDMAVAQEGWKIVMLTRLSPVFPFNLINYAYGLTAVSPRAYILASWIGMLPGTVMYVYIGSLAGDLAAAAAGEQTAMPGPWMIAARIAGLAAAVVVTLLIARTARRALRVHME